MTSFEHLYRKFSIDEALWTLAALVAARKPLGTASRLKRMVLSPYVAVCCPNVGGSESSNTLRFTYNLISALQFVSVYAI